ALLSCSLSPRLRSAMLIVSSFSRLMLARLSFIGLLSIGEKPIPTTGGVALKALKKLNGARLCPPPSLTVPTQAIGRGTIAEVIRKYLRPGERLAGSMGLGTPVLK